MDDMKVGDIVKISDGFDRVIKQKILEVKIVNGRLRYKLEGWFKWFSDKEFL